MSTDAIVCFDRDPADQLVYRLKRAGHVASKMRFQSVQLDAYLADGLWLRLATNANTTMARLARGLVDLGVELIATPEVNMAYARIDDAVADRLEADGLDFYRMGDATIRLVTSFQTTTDDVERALKVFASAVV